MRRWIKAHHIATRQIFNATIECILDARRRNRSIRCEAMDIECQAIDNDFHNPRGMQYAGNADIGTRYIRYHPVQGIMIGQTARFEQQQETRQA